MKLHFDFLKHNFLFKNKDSHPLDWIKVNKCEFLMGSPLDEFGRCKSEIIHKVKLSSFRISKFPITVSQFEVFVQATDYLTDAEVGSGDYWGSYFWNGEKWKLGEGINWRFSPIGKFRKLSEKNHPVTHVSWNDAIAYSNWLNCRLPTEAEWECACRAGTTSAFSTGDTLNTSEANFNGNYPYANNLAGEYRYNTTPVDTFKPNQWGIFDMHGNVWEWCQDFFGEYNSISQINPKGPEKGISHINRGGSWNCGAKRCRSARRGSGDPFYRSGSIGFRISK